MSGGVPMSGVGASQTSPTIATPGAYAPYGASPEKRALIVGGGHEPARSVSLTSQTLERWSVDRSQGPLKPKHIWAIRQHVKSIGSARDLAMFNIALDAKLRGCDFVKLRLGDIARGAVVRQRSTIIQQKTGRPVTEAARDALAHWLESRGRRRDDWLFPSRSRDGAHIGTSLRVLGNRARPEMRQATA
jgi:hypothetical protein